MGVPYKLDKKIVEFIISQKQSRSELGCRDFVNLISDKFGLIISKSTVNAVIKEAGLSKRTGRPRFARIKEAKPLEKPRPLKDVLARALPKSEITFSVEKKSEPPKDIVLPKEKIEPFPLPLPAKAPELEKPKAKPLPEIPKEPLIQNPETPPVEKPVASPKEELLKKPVFQTPTETPQKIKKEIPFTQLPSFIQPLINKEDETFDCLGAFFLKAAEWEISKTSILGNLIRGLSPQLDPLDAEIKSNALLYLPVFGMDNLEALDGYRKGGLWLFLNSKQKLSAQDLSGFFQQLQSTQELFHDLYYECDNSFKEAIYFKFILADGTVFFIDARLKSIWQEPAVPDNFTVSPQKAKHYIDEKFIQIFTAETRPVLLFNVPSFRSFSNAVSDFVLAFEDHPTKRIMGIDIISSNNQEIDSYKHLASAKRSFVFGFWPWQKEAKEFLKSNIGVVNNFYFSELARQVYYTESQLEFPEASGNKLNIIFLKNSAFSSPRMGLASNIPNHVMKTEELIKSYLLRWPNFEDTYQDILASSERLTYRGFIYPAFDEEAKPKREQAYILPKPENSLNDNLKLLLNNLNIAASRHFFPYGYRFADFETMKQRFYSLSGRLKRKDHNLFLTLLVPKDYPYSNDLFYAVRRINESKVIDSFGCKLWFKVL